MILRRIEYNERGTFMNQQSPGEPGQTNTRSRMDWKGYASAIGVTVLATALGWLPYHGLHWPDENHEPFLADSNVLMLYLLGVLWVAGRFSRGAAIAASILAVAAFDFCFVRPYLTFDVADRQYLITFAVMLLTALIISTLTHRVRQHAQAAKEAWERAEAEFLRNTLLSGVSHDLRTPLAAITGAASSLIETGEKLPPPARDELIDLIYSQAQRMERQVNNLLEMTRLESGELKLNREPQPLQGALGSALRLLERRLDGRQVITSIPSDLPLVKVDDVAIEQVLTNLIDNALQYTPLDSPIEISARVSGEQVIVEISDRGPGLPVGAEHRIFEKFF